MKLRYLMVLAAIGVFVASASGGVIMNSTETHPTGCVWGINSDPMLGWKSATSSWGKINLTFGKDGTTRTEDGTGSMKIKFTTGQGSAVGVIQFASVVGQEYTLQGYVYPRGQGGVEPPAGWYEYLLLDGSDWSAWDSGGFMNVLEDVEGLAWNEFTDVTVATGTTMTIMVKCGTNSGTYLDVYIDDISIAETPEPASLALLAPGLLLLSRRRRT